VFSSLCLHDLASDTFDRLVTTTDDADTCGMSYLYPKPNTSITREYIGRVDFQGGAAGPGTMTVIVQRGTKSLTPEDWDACANGSYTQDPTIVVVKPRKITFNWNGKTFRQMPSPTSPGPR